jgi:hypothetical protein
MLMATSTRRAEPPFEATTVGQLATGERGRGGCCSRRTERLRSGATEVFFAMTDSDQAESNPPANAMNVPQFADELPDACPPGDAIDASGTFYATHRVSPPDVNDFRTAAARNAFKGQNECKRRGNSVMASLDDARQLCRAYPDVHIHVSEGVLNQEHGKLLEDASMRYPSHHTLWRYAGVTMHGIFDKVV